MTVMDKIKGIFTDNDAKPEKEPINTPQEQKMYEMVNSDYQVFKEHRQTMEEQWRIESRFYRGDHWYGIRKDSMVKKRPSNTDNICGAQIDSILGKITGWDPYPDFEAQEESDEQKAQDLNEFIPFELRQIGFRSKYVLAVKTAVIHGPLVFKTIFDPTVEGGRGKFKYDGQNDILPVDLGTFFPDPRVKDFIYLQKMGAIIINTRQTLEYIRDRWPKQGNKVMPDEDYNETDIFNIDGSTQDSFNYTSSSTEDYSSQRNTVGLIEYWYRGLPKMISREDKEMFEEQAMQKVVEGKDPSETIAKADGTMEGVHCIYVTTGGVFLEHKSYVYDHGKYPFSARTLSPIEGNIWGKGFMRDMIKPQTMLNRFAELAVETMSKQGNAGIVYEEGAISHNQVRVWKETRSTPGAMLPVAQDAMNKWKELQGVDVPTSVFNMIQHYLEMLQKIPGQFDSANGQASSNVTSGEQAKALISAASTRLNTVTDAIQESLEEVFGQYVELIAQFYTTERVARVTGRRVSMSRDSLVNGVPIDMMLESESGAPETKELIEEYVPMFDIKVNISADKPVDREYWVATANNLIQQIDPTTGMPMIDGEAVRYVIQYGRMEPFNVIKKRMEQAAGVQQKIQELQMMTDQLTQENQGLQQKLSETDQVKMAQELQGKEFDQNLQSRKLDIEAAKVVGSLNQNSQKTPA